MKIVSLESIGKQFADRPLFEHVTLGIEAGEHVGLVGVNGSGKTTLMRILAGAEQPDTGRLSMMRGLRVSYLPQNPQLDPDLTVIEQIFRGDMPEIGLLRSYEQAAVELASTLIVPADLLILDEPTNHIDIETVPWLESFLTRSTAALLLVTHDRYFLDRVVNRIIEIERGKRYGERTLVRNLTLSIAPRDRLGIIGPNGSGKTTLLNMIARRVAPDSGRIVVGETVHLAYYDQESAGLDEAQRVIDYIKQGAELIRTGEGATITAAQMLERFLFAPAAHYTPIAKLSGGERRRLYLLRKLMAAPNVLLLDEPTNDLDIQTLGVLEDYLDDFAGALLVGSHDRYFLDRTAERLLAFEGDGRVAEYPGNYSAYAETRSNVERSNVPSPKPRKLSFKEARELQELENKIAGLESAQAELEAQINAAGSDYQAFIRLTGELEHASAALEATFERWSELAEIAEGVG